jgi:hypothetical protein
MAVQTRIQMRRGELTLPNGSGWSQLNPTLSAGELGLDTTTKRYKIGDGLTPWNSLAYSSILPSNTDLIGASGIGLSFSSVTGVPITISVTGIQSSQVNDFASAVNTLINSETIQDIIGVSVTGVSGIAVSYNDTTGYTTISLSDPTIQVSDITNFASGVNSLIDSAVSTSIVAGSGVDIVYNSGNNTLTVSSALTAGSGISLSHSSGNYVVSLSDPTIELSNITDLSSNARNFLLTPSSSGLRTLVPDETGSGIVVFNDSPTLITPTISSGILAGTSSMDVFNTTATTVNAFGAATTLNIGGVTSSNSTINIATAAINSSLVKTVNIGTNANSFSTSNINIGTGGMGISASNINIGTNGAGTTTINNNIVASGNLTVSGSGLVASNINNFDSQVRTNRLDQMAVPTADVSLNSRKITNLATPTGDNDAATKAYVDAARSGLDVKQSVRVATTANITLSGAQTIDGVSAVAGDRVLVKNQSTASQNGIYVVAAGSWSRATDADSDVKVTAGMFVFVTEGATNADSGWVLTTNDTIALGTTGLAFAQFSGAGQITAGDGLTKSGNTINVVGTAGRIVANVDSIDLDTVSRTDTTGSPGASFVQTVTTDSYGRVTAVTTGSISFVDGGTP